MKASYILLIFLLLLVTGYLLYQTILLREELDENIAKVDGLTAELDEANEDISELNDALRETNSELDTTKERLSNTSMELNDTKKELEDRTEELETAKEELNQTLGLLEGLREEFSGLRDEVSDIEESINSSIQWFKGNSVIPPSLDSFMARSDARCVEDRDLNLGCVPFLMERQLDFVYKHEYPDRLYSIGEMVENRGGDCEDYSLFLKAFLNSFKETGERVRLKGWEESPGSEFVIYRTAERYWYYEGDEVYLGSLDSLHPYVICYITKYTPPLREGHCIIALSEGEISSAEDLGKLDGAATFEPQNGRYEGTIGNEFHLCTEGDLLCDTGPNNIFFIIADDDLYQFTEGEWKYYRRYQESVSEFGEKIDEVLEGIPGSEQVE